ncbi:TIGR02270 family protein [Myxococcus eversor]|uniref:TIGR02270 family protein n=1 Tax=Myxococcus eversor TaxID=2709661 RepID=UPI0013D64C0B|nr:TIGR02270 family protein [Myxococcus eversor]
MWDRPDEQLRWDVLETHFEEACFLWTQWEGNLSSSRHTLADVAGGNELRLRAHLRALVLGGPRVAERLLIPALGEEDSEKLRVASHTLLAMDGYADLVMRTFQEAPDELRGAMARALSLSERPGLSKQLLPLLAMDDPDLQATLLEVLSFRRGLPPEPLLRLCQHEVPRVQAAALRAACAVNLPEDPRLLRKALGSPSAAVRAAGLRWGLVRNSREAFLACLDWSDARDEGGDLARLAMSMGGEPAHLTRMLRLLDVSTLRREALWAVGFSGKVAAVEACLPWLRDAKHAGVAAESFCAITGLVLTEHFRKEREEPDEEEDASDKEPRDAHLELPRPEAIETWWAEKRPRFGKDARYLAGRPFTAEALVDSLSSAVTRRRAPLALELAIRTQGRHAVEVLDFSHLQTHRLTELRSLGSRALWTGPFLTQMSH